MSPQLKVSQILAGMSGLLEERQTSCQGTSRRGRLYVYCRCSAIWGDGSLGMIRAWTRLARSGRRGSIRSGRGAVGDLRGRPISGVSSAPHDRSRQTNEAEPPSRRRLAQKEVDIDRLAVDTHGYTEFATAIAKLSASRCVHGWHACCKRKLYVPSGMRTFPGSLTSIVIPTFHCNDTAIVDAQVHRGAHRKLDRQRRRRWPSRFRIRS